MPRYTVASEIYQKTSGLLGAHEDLGPIRRKEARRSQFLCARDKGIILVQDNIQLLRIASKLHNMKVKVPQRSVRAQTSAKGNTQTRISTKKYVRSTPPV